MQYKTKRTTPETVAAATTDGVSSEPTGTRSASRPPESRAGRAGGAAADPRDVQLDVLASCAAVLLTSGAGKLEDAFAVLAPPLELDAYACFVASEGDHSFAFESAHGLSDVALSSSAIAAIVTELTVAGQRTLVLEALRQSADARSAALRDLDFASAVIGALVVDDHVLGAVVFASRSKEVFTLRRGRADRYRSLLPDRGVRAARDGATSAQCGAAQARVPHGARARASQSSCAAAQCSRDHAEQRSGALARRAFRLRNDRAATAANRSPSRRSARCQPGRAAATSSSRSNVCCSTRSSSVRRASHGHGSSPRGILSSSTCRVTRLRLTPIRNAWRACSPTSSTPQRAAWIAAAAS